jgi:hypothetical protein
VKRTTHGEVRCFVQLILEGTPDQIEQQVLSDAASALDIGPSTVAGIGADDPFLARFCDEVTPPRKEIRRGPKRRGAVAPPIPATASPTAASRKGPRSGKVKLRQTQRRVAATRKKLPGQLQKPLLRWAKPRLSCQTANRGHLPASSGLSLDAPEREPFVRCRRLDPCRGSGC